MVYLETHPHRKLIGVYLETPPHRKLIGLYLETKEISFIRNLIKYHQNKEYLNQAIIL